MPRSKTISREQYRDAVMNLLDLGFTPPAIAYMVGKSDVSIYTLLERNGRKKGRSFKRHDPTVVRVDAVRYMSRLFAKPDVAAIYLRAASLLPRNST